MRRSHEPQTQKSPCSEMGPCSPGPPPIGRARPQRPAPPPSARSGLCRRAARPARPLRQQGSRRPSPPCRAGGHPGAMPRRPSTPPPPPRGGPVVAAHRLRGRDGSGGGGQEPVLPKAARLIVAPRSLESQVAHLRLMTRQVQGGAAPPAVQGRLRLDAAARAFRRLRQASRRQSGLRPASVHRSLPTCRVSPRRCSRRHCPPVTPRSAPRRSVLRAVATAHSRLRKSAWIAAAGSPIGAA